MQGIPGAMPGADTGMYPQLPIQTAQAGAPPLNQQPYVNNASYNAYAAKYAN